MSDIFDRQRRVSENWDQDILTNLRILILGDNPISDRLLLASSAFGIGKIYHIKKNLQNKYRLLGDSKFGHPREILRGLFEYVKYVPVSQVSEVTDANVIIDVSNDPFNKKEAIDYCQEKGIFFQSISSTEDRCYYFSLDTFNEPVVEEKLENVLENFHEKKQGSFTSTFGVGVLLENLRRRFMQLYEDEKLKQDVIYNARSLTRFDGFEDSPCNGSPFDKRTILLAGTGAIGNPIALDLIHYDLEKLILVDKDVVEETNLNRQVGLFNLHTDRSYGRKKVEVLEERLAKLNSRVNMESFGEKFSAERDYAGKDYGHVDLIISAVDSHISRKQIQDYAYRKIPVINTASTGGGQVRVSSYNQTSCLNCSLNLKRRVENEEADLGDLKNEIKAKFPYLSDDEVTRLADGADSCSLSNGDYEKLQEIRDKRRLPAVIMPNLITAALAVGESRTVFDSKSYGPPLNATINYQSSSEIKFYFRAGKVCNHYRTENTSWRWRKFCRSLIKRGYEKSNYHG